MEQWQGKMASGRGAFEEEQRKFQSDALKTQATATVVGGILLFLSSKFVLQS